MLHCQCVFSCSATLQLLLPRLPSLNRSLHRLRVVLTPLPTAVTTPTWTCSGHPAEPSFEQAIDQALSAGQEQAREALPQVTASKEELAAMGVKDLKAILDERKLSYAGITEKSELVDLIDSQCRSITYYK